MPERLVLKVWMYMHGAMSLAFEGARTPSCVECCRQRLDACPRPFRQDQARQRSAHIWTELKNMQGSAKSQSHANFPEAPIQAAPMSFTKPPFSPLLG